MSDVVEREALRVFCELVELPTAQRAAGLERECGGHPALRERVERLLAAADREGAFLKGAPLPTPGRSQGALDEAFAPGTQVGDYTLVAPLGEGGFGLVFEAEQERPVRRRVAIKLLRQDLGLAAWSAAVARFEQERQALAIMDHPGIARVFDAGATPSGRPYFVMELVRGEAITSWADRSGLDVRARLELLVDVCRAVQHAHAKGVIHRDLKPSNVLVGAGDGGRPAVKVIDFGIAKALQPLTDRTLWTDARQLIGTPEYMSPEQAAGSPDIDIQSDVYSLGVLAYELLAGATPFEGLRAAPLAEMQRVLQEVDPPTPSRRLTQAREVLEQSAARRGTDPRRLVSTLRGELDWIVMRALEKERARRYDSAASFADDLERHLAGEPVTAAPPSALYRARKLVRRHRGAVLAASLVALALVAGIAATSSALMRLRRAQGALVEETAHARAEAARADREADAARLQARVAASANELLKTMVEKANRSRQGGRADITVREVMDVAAAELRERATPREPAVELLLASTIGGVYRELGLYEPAEEMRRLAVARAAELHGADSVEHATALSELAALLVLRADAEEAARAVEQAGAILAAAPEDEGSAAARAALRVNRATQLAGEGRLDEAQAELEEALRYYEAHPETPTLEHATALHNLAAVRHERGELAGSVQLLERVIELEREAYGPDDPRTLATLHGLGVVQVSAGQLVEGERTFMAAIDTARRLQGGEHPQLGVLLYSLGMVRTRLGQSASAAEALREARAVLGAALGPRHPETVDATRELARTLLALDELEEAESLLREALLALTGTDDAEEGARRGAATHKSMFCWLLLAEVLRRLDASDEAEAILDAAVANAAGAGSAEGEHEWLLRGMESALGELLFERAEREPDDDARLALLRVAEPLLTSSAERLLELAPGPKVQQETAAAAVQRAARLCERLAELEPGEARELARARWRERAALR